MQSLQQSKTSKAVAAPHVIDMPVDYWARLAVEHGRWAFAAGIGAYAVMIAALYLIAHCLQFDVAIWPFLAVLLPLPLKSLSTAVLRRDGELQRVEVRWDEARHLERVQMLKLAVAAEIAALTLMFFFALPHTVGWMAGFSAGAMAIAAARTNGNHWQDELDKAIKAGIERDGITEIALKNGFGGANFDD